MLKKSSSFVLASLRGSGDWLCRPRRCLSRYLTGTATNRISGSPLSLAAAALDGHFEHPVNRSFNITVRKIAVNVEQKLSFPAACNQEKTR